MSTKASSRWDRFASPGVALAILVAFWALLMASVSNKSLTADEIAHATAGYAYWRYDDYRFNPENGNLPQRIMGLPLFFSDARYPSTDSVEWRTSDEWTFGYRWFHGLGNNVETMLFHGRAAIGLVTALLGALVWWWSRRLFGPVGGLLSLLLLVLNPTVLANGALMTSDATAAFCFLAATAGIWAVLHRITLTRVVLGGLGVGLLFVAKMSAPLIIPIALTLAAIRVGRGQPLLVEIGSRRELKQRGQQIGAIALVALVQTLITWAVVWGSFGFRYSAFSDANQVQSSFAQRWELVLDKTDPLEVIGELGLSPEQNQKLAALMAATPIAKTPWTPARVDVATAARQQILDADQQRRFDAIRRTPSPSLVGGFVEFAREHHLLPEAYLFGTLHTLKFARARSAFLNGEVSVTGWRTFFPYTFLVKTPLTVFMLLALALAAAFALRRQSSALPAVSGFPASESLTYQCTPLWVLLGFYWAAVLTSHLNIGHRHILVTYPPLFILAGVAASWWQPQAEREMIGGIQRRWLGWATLVCLLLLATETLARFPNYLAYFNPIVGGPSRGYRHLVDSSLDWGQDLPAVKAYLQRERPSEPVYLSYFGNASPDYYQIPARSLYSFEGQDVIPPLKLLTAAAADAQSVVGDFMRKHPDYSVAGSARGADGSVLVLLLKDPDSLRLKGGRYLVSATMLQPVLYELTGPLGPWNARYEAAYQQLRAQVQPFFSDDPRVRLEALRSRRPAEWANLLQSFEMFRFARLTAWLRKREPQAQINYSILVYRLTDNDLAEALEGPPPEMGVDVPQSMVTGTRTVESSPAVAPR